MTKTSPRVRRVLAALALLTGLSLLLAACGPNGSGQAGAGQTRAAAAASSALANPTVSAEADAFKGLVASCFPKTPLAQLKTVHVVFLESAHGKNGDAVQAARAKLFGCLGIPDDKRQDFVNDGLTAALHANPKLTTHAGRVTYFEVTLPQLVLKYKGAATASGTPGSTATATPKATAKATPSVSGTGSGQ
jgi:hypothetical protein